ncbi:hypothetical protein C8R21_13025 [Nitrosospira multiformis]|uniref:Uncharacterized protein n=1 Tax=Nitrosospira multiformis TaxID=1231 RepID=A0A2T5I658_9PROT|nr:hypothetical protein [Nitrosospira multiformis]PTQ79313.1 hypothetical protein C8R21_13025 [Nitrosospira multiformis]
MARYGWIVAVERAPLLESDAGEDAFFTINLVRPWSDQEKQDDPRGPQLPDPWGATGDLWLPWTWKDADYWVVYGQFKDAAGALKWQEINTASVKRPAASKVFASKDAFMEAITAEVKAATKNTEYPLSQAMEDHRKVGWRSHVHTLAPLTHWPARLSGGALRLTWLLSNKKKAFDDCVAVVCFPKFTIKEGTVVTEQVQVPTHGTLKEADVDFKTKKSFSIDYADKAVGFLALAADPLVAAGKLPDDGLELSQGAVSRSTLQSAFTNNLLPLSVLLAWMVDPTPTAVDEQAMQAALVRALWAALGFGREYMGDDGKRPNVVEFLVNNVADARVLRKAIERGVDGISPATALTAFTSMVKVLSEAKTSKDWTQERHSVWADLQKAIRAMLDGTPKTAEQFRAEWLAPARLLATEDGQREAMGVWLGSVLDPLFLGPANPGDADEIAAWRPVKEKLVRVGEFGKDLVMRAQPFTASPPLWDAARTVSRTPGDTVALATLTRKAIEAVSAALGQPGHLPDGIEQAVKEQVQKFVDELAGAADGNRPRPHDRGLKLDFSGWDASAAAGSDHRIRGYAIGLCAGYVASKGSKWKPDTKRAQWLTDTAVLVNAQWATDADGETAWMHEAVGATATNGEKLVSVEYEGAPVATALAVDGLMKYEGEDPDGFKTIDFAWKDDEQDRQLPLLGYGLYYAAKATPLDNVGAVIDEKLRKTVGNDLYVTELKDAGEVLGTLNAPFQYVSSEAPGAPDCEQIKDSYYELSDETQAHAWQASEIVRAVEVAAVDSGKRVPTLQKVALLAKPQTVATPAGNMVLFPVANDKCEFKVSAHGTHWAFIDRWLATDRLLVENQMMPSDADLGPDAAVIHTFANTFREKMGPRDADKKTPAYHPAVNAIGVELIVFGKSVAHDVVPIKRVHKDAAGVLSAAEDKVNVVVAATAAGAPTLTVTPARKSVALDVPRGASACLRFYSLVDENYFESGSTKQRYAEKLANTDVTLFTGFRAFSPTERWFETLPEWLGDGSLPPAQVTMHLAPPQETSGGLLLSPNLLVADLKFPQAEKWTQWLKGAYIQRHEWHWTGYPVDFPSQASELAAWIPSLAGVQSFREIIDAKFTTSFAKIAQGKVEWLIGLDASGKAVVHRWALALGARPARYVAYLARPVLRFKRWLNPKLGNAGPQAVEADIYARGQLVPGRMREGPFDRLATPALKHGIPLTATYSKGLKRGANGVMLVFDDAIRRTDDLARVGGLGDTIEVDLVDTRIEGVSEIGNNPIFHGPEPQPKGLTLLTDPAFGLTFDTGPNPKVTQTAIVVRPRNAGGRWVMARARARRLILPETELGTMLHAHMTPEAPPHLAEIPTRLEGKDVVPLDFVVDLGAPLQKPMQLSSSYATDTLTLVVPKPPLADAKLKYRYLVTWHKARWADGGDSKWRCQVMLQSRGDTYLAWNTLPGTIRGFQNAKSELPSSKFVERWYLTAESAGANPVVRRVRISDYTDPRWLTFIGSFGNESPGVAHDYRFVMRNGKLGRLEIAIGRMAPLPKLRNRDTSLKGDDPTFHLALVFHAVPDVVQLRTEQGTGELRACYFVDSNDDSIFLPRTVGETPPTSLDGCYSYIVTLQRISSPSKDEKQKLRDAVSLTDLLECAFPDQGTSAKESILRITPEYFGPVPIDSVPM